MSLVDQWEVPRVRGANGAARIQLLTGDLARIPTEHAIDALVVSAFPDSYTPNEGTVFESLHARGLDMRRVAERKEEDERSRLGCWLSKQLPRSTAGRFHFDRIICFEPRYQAFLDNTGIDPQRPEDGVPYVFRCLNNFVIPDVRGRQRFKISRLAMPMLATGNQSVPLETMLPRLLEAAVFWLEQGLPVDVLKIVAFSDTRKAARLFRQARSRYQSRAPGPTSPAAAADAKAESEIDLAHDLTRRAVQACRRHIRQELLAAASKSERAIIERVFEKVNRMRPAAEDTSVAHDHYDFFISYSHKQEADVRHLVEALRATVPRPNVFIDNSSIPSGAHWIKMISEAIQNADTFVAVLSPDYTASPVCWDEFQCAKLKEYTTRQSVIKTVRLYREESMPPIIGIANYIDCAEGDIEKLRRAASKLRQ